MSHRIAVTSLGVCAPNGTGVESFWEALLAGRIGTRPVESFDTSPYCTRMGGVVDVDLDAISRSASPYRARAGRLAAAAARLALKEGSVDAPSERIGVVMGTVVADRPAIELEVTDAFAAGQSIHELERSRFDAGAVSASVAHEIGARGPVVTLPMACAAGNAAIARAAELLRRGRIDVAVAGGADSLSPAMYLMFSQHESMSPDVVRPFDPGRQGLILAEGSAAIVLEREEDAKARGREPLAYVTGWAAHPDAWDIAHPHPEGVGAALSMTAALRRAGLDPGDVDHISAHGTGTPANDAVEALAIRSVFGERSPPVSAIKSMIGHTQGAACAIEAVASVLSIVHQVIPPTINVRTVDPDLGVDVVIDRPRATEVRTVLSNGFGLGGNVCCVVFEGA